MKEYELINPYNPYTFLAPDLEVAALVVFSIGVQFGAKTLDGETVPVFLLGRAKEWYKETFGRTPDEGLVNRKEELIAALESMVYGDFEDRCRYEAALEAITDDKKREEFIEKWQDGHSSLNDIGGYCKDLAKRIRG